MGCGLVLMDKAQPTMMPGLAEPLGAREEDDEDEDKEEEEEEGVASGSAAAALPTPASAPIPAPVPAPAPTELDTTTLPCTPLAIPPSMLIKASTWSSSTGSSSTMQGEGWSTAGMPKCLKTDSIWL